MSTSEVCSTTIARLFSATVVRELASRGKSPLAARLIQDSGLLPALKQDALVSDVFELAFERLKARQNRHEYIYKAAITEKILLGVHNLDTASMLTEFRVGDCKADAVVLNGTASAYEIKSERDSLSRLGKQVARYRTVFATVNVIVGANHLEQVIQQVPSDVGVMTLSSAFTISTIREPTENFDTVSPLAIFEVMNSKEAERMLLSMGVRICEVPNTLRYGELRKHFVALDAQSAHKAMVTTLKQTRNLRPLKTLIDEVPKPLRSAALSTKIRRRDHSRLTKALRTTLSHALQWA